MVKRRKSGKGKAGEALANREAQAALPGTQSPEPDPPAGLLEIVEPEFYNMVRLRPYQKRWVNDPSRFAIAVKSAQIGFSTATAAWAVDRCLRMPQRTVVFLSRSERQSKELAEKAKGWLVGYHGVAAHMLPGRYFEGTSAMQHEIRFPNGARIIVLAANPDTARGYTGDVVLDEFAFHQDSQAIFTAVYRQVSLGYQMRVLSTPNGAQGKFYEIAKSLDLDSGGRPAQQPVRIGSRESGVGSRERRAGSGESGVANREARAANSESGVGNREDETTTSSSPTPYSPLPTPHSPMPTPSRNPWSGHWVDVFLAVEEGLPLDPQEVKAGCDEETWLQEYCCQFVSAGGQWITQELYQQCVSREASTEIEFGIGDSGFGVRKEDGFESRIPNPEPRFYAGWDIARKRDLSVIWLVELVGDVTWTRGVIEMRNTPTPDQLRRARALMPLVRRMEIDMGGMGLAISEALAREFPDRIEGLQFTSAKKEIMAVTAKRRMEEGKVRLPESEPIRQSFRSVRRSVNALGQSRFDAEHDARFGHADHWWAFCLAEAAAQQQTVSTVRLAEVADVIGRPFSAGLTHAVPELMPRLRGYGAAGTPIG